MITWCYLAYVRGIIEFQDSSIPLHALSLETKMLIDMSLSLRHDSIVV